MNFYMTHSTKRYNIKSLTEIITGMVIFLCLIPTFTYKIICWFQFSRYNCFCNCIRSTNFRRIVILPFFLSTIFCKFSSFAFAIKYFFESCLFAFWIMFIGTTLFTSSVMTTFLSFILVKFSEFFNLFAFTTSFCYDWFRHNCFLVKQLCLEPVKDYISLIGLFYYTTIFPNSKQNYNYLGDF